MDEQIILAKELLKNVRHLALSTVNEDGSPHNSPLLMILSEDLTKLYIGSHESALHSRNLVRTRKAFAVIYDSNVAGKGGLYMTCSHARVCEGEQLVEALRVHNGVRKKQGKDPIDISYYDHKEPGQRMYVMNIDRIEVYVAERGRDGHIAYEERQTVAPKDLVS